MLENLQTELKHFIRNRRIDEKYDYVIPIERKGMALLRFLLEEEHDSHNIVLDTKRLISSEALSSLTSGSLDGKRIWIFDDTVFTGKLLRSEIERIQRSGAKVDSSAFLVYQGAGTMPDTWYYGHLSFSDYSYLRSEVISLIAGSEKLLLDSEHIALCVRTTLAKEEIVEALRLLGDLLLIPCVKKTDRLAVSIHKPKFFNVLDQAIPEQVIDKIFCKVRFLVSDGSLWIVPIAYPPVPLSANTMGCPTFTTGRGEELCICPKSSDGSARAFYCRALFMGVKLLASTLAKLHNAMPFTVDLDSAEVFPLENLTALFPNFNLEAWRSWIKKSIIESVDSEGRDAARPQQKHDVLEFNEEAKIGLKRILDILVDQHEYVDIENGFDEEATCLISPSQFGVLYTDLIKLLVAEGIPEPRISQAFDALIDQSFVVPMPMPSPSPNPEYWARGMRLDGEFTYNFVRQARLSSIGTRKMGVE